MKNVCVEALQYVDNPSSFFLGISSTLERSLIGPGSQPRHGLLLLLVVRYTPCFFLWNMISRKQGQRLRNALGVIRAVRVAREDNKHEEGDATTVCVYICTWVGLCRTQPRAFRAVAPYREAFMRVSRMKTRAWRWRMQWMYTALPYTGGLLTSCTP